MNRLRVLLVCCILLLFGSSMVYAQDQMPSPENSDPVSLGLMQGFPVPPDKQVTRLNFEQFPYNRWAFHNIRELNPTRNVWRGQQRPIPLEYALKNLDDTVFQDENGNRITSQEWQKNTFTDAIIIMHQGKIVYERYYHSMRPEIPHMLFSMTKSFIGLLATQFIYEGKLDPSRLVSHYIPELSDSAWGDATVQQTLDMTTAIDFTEIYDDPTSDIYRYAYASGAIAAPAEYDGPIGITSYLQTLKKKGEHGEVFKYRSVNTEVIGWILCRMTGKTLSELLSERIWEVVGAEECAYFWLTNNGSEMMVGGLNATLRDLARFGIMLLHDGFINGRQVFSPEAIKEIRRGGDREKFKKGNAYREGYSYHNQWWITHNPDGAFEAWGVNGQVLHINPAKQIVIAKFSSHPVASNNTRHHLDKNAFSAIAEIVPD